MEEQWRRCEGNQQSDKCQGYNGHAVNLHEYDEAHSCE